MINLFSPPEKDLKLSIVIFKSAANTSSPCPPLETLWVPAVSTVTSWYIFYKYMPAFSFILFLHTFIFIDWCLCWFWFWHFQSSIFDLHQHFQMRKAEEVQPSDCRKDTQPDRLVSRPQCWQLHQHAERHSGRTGDERREDSNWKWQLKLNSGAVSSNRGSEVSGVCRSSSPGGSSSEPDLAEWHFSDFRIFCYILSLLHPSCL